MMKKHWTKSEDKILIKNWSKMNTWEIMKLIPNRTNKSIEKRAIRLKLKKGKNYKIRQMCGKIITIDKFIERAIKKHGEKYDYSHIKYVNYETSVLIKCNKHKIFFKQVPYNHIGCIGCPKCVTEMVTLGKKVFIDRSKNIHGKKYKYNLIEYINIRTKVKIICVKHGVFEQKPDTHLDGHGCPNCKTSRNENIISDFLTKNKIKFTKEKTFDGCRLKHKLRFDFYLPKYNLCIEYDGLQHHEYVEYFNSIDKLEITKKRDNIKNEYCKNNNILLLRISYKDDTIEVLTNFLKNKLKIKLKK